MTNDPTPGFVWGPVRPGRTLVLALTLILAAAASADPQEITFAASDGETVYGTLYRAEGRAAALILAFHQGGASGAAEYGPIAARLNREGHDVLAIDQRAGGERFGGVNRTVAARGTEAGFCEAAPDLEEALRYAREQHPDRPIVLWGSSYSGALALRLAATRPAAVVAVLAFSPASGGPMAACRGEELSDRIRVPVLVLRPRSEMSRESSVAQFERFRMQGHRTHVADPGTHGSSMLVENRVGAPVEATWSVVLEFLSGLDR